MAASNSNMRIARNSVFLTIRMFIVLIITLFTTRLLLKSLGVADYGVYNVVCGFVSMFAFLNTSMTNGIQRFYNFSLGNKSEFTEAEVFVTSLRIQFLLAIIIITLTETVGLWYLHNKMVIPEDRFFAAQWIFQLSVISFLLMIIQAPFSAAIMAHEHMDYYAIVSVLDAVLKLVIAIVLKFFIVDHLIVYGALLLLISVINFLFYFAYARVKFEEIRIVRTKKTALFGSMLSFSGWNIFGSFSGVMKDQGINLVINYFMGPVVNAAKGVASQVNGAFQGVVGNLTVAMRPQLIQSYAEGNVNRTMRLTYSISKISCCVLYFVSWPVVLEINYILGLWLDNTVPEHTASFVIWVLLISFINSLNSAISGVIHASGRMMAYQVISSLISSLCVPAAYVALKMGSEPEIAFVCTLVFSLLAHIAGLFILRTIVHYSIKDYVKKVFIPFFLLVVLTFALPLIPHHFMSEGVARILVVFVTSSIIIIPIMYYVALDKDEKKMVSRFITSLFGRFQKKSAKE